MKKNCNKKTLRIKIFKRDEPLQFWFCNEYPRASYQFILFPFVHFSVILCQFHATPALSSSPLLFSLQTCLWSKDLTPFTSHSNPLEVLLTDTQFSCFIAYDKPCLWSLITRRFFGNGLCALRLNIARNGAKS